MPKSSTCLICKAEVSNRKSYAVVLNDRNGRACRKHKEAQKQAVDRRTASKVKLIGHINNAKFFDCMA